MHTPAFICDAVRTPFCLSGGALAGIRVDELAAAPLIALMVRSARVDWEQLDDVLYGCANQNESCGDNLAHAATRQAGLPDSVAAATLNRLSGSGLEAISMAARAIKAGEAGMLIAAGVSAAVHVEPGPTAESSEARNDFADVFSHAPFPIVDCKTALAAQHLAGLFGVDRAAQDRYAHAARTRFGIARQSGWFNEEIIPVTAVRRQDDPILITEDGPSTVMSMDVLGRLPSLAGTTSLTTGNCAAQADGACALLLANEKLAHRYSLVPRARVLATAVSGVPDAELGLGPAVAARKVLVQTGLTMEQIEIIELHDACAALSLAVLRDWRLQDDDARVNPHGSALALGNPSGASGARLVLSALRQLQRVRGRYALCALCVGAGQGMAMVIERV